MSQFCHWARIRPADPSDLNIEPVPFSPSLSGPSSAGSGISPKRSWFNNLFSFKAPSFTLVSSDNIGNTRERAKKLLGGINVRTETIEIDGLRALKCRYDEVKGESSWGVTATLLTVQTLTVVSLSPRVCVSESSFLDRRPCRAAVTTPSFRSRRRKERNQPSDVSSLFY